MQCALGPIPMGYPYYKNEILIDRPDAESLDRE